MDFYSILGKSPKGLYDNILFNPLEENFYIPAVTVEVGYFQGTDLKVVGYKIHNHVSTTVRDGVLKPVDIDSNFAIKF